ncbi:hypothetical protein LAZ67_5004230 [Cordylochernes scorpioides]|uniref:Transposase n=1 Tax=Cordylochernes scorpioides TaxID=51811 RepID=A0ABY6KIY0_9ARAC|nr:hypothetical protein LAZ67_5004230 [Cordylochernes scorpioides]
MPGHRKRRQYKQTDAFTRGMVIGQKRAGWSIRQIAADTHLGASTVHRLWRRWLEQGNVAIYRNAGATRVTSARVDRRILRQAVAAPQATCTAILQHVQDTLDHSISTRAISRRLVANGLHSCRPLRRLPLTPPNRRQRLEWCRARSTWMTEWHRVVFSDESRFCLSSDSRRVRVWRRRGERSNPAAIVERPTGDNGTMTAQRYVDDVLRPVTLPYLQGVPNALYQQDNARPHTARISQQALQDVQMLPWPPYSPDLSPIEHVWDIIGRRLHALPQPRSEDELWQMVEREWRAIPQDAIRTLIDSLPRRVAACIAVRGKSSKRSAQLVDGVNKLHMEEDDTGFTKVEHRKKRPVDSEAAGQKAKRDCVQAAAAKPTLTQRPLPKFKVQETTAIRQKRRRSEPGRRKSDSYGFDNGWKVLHLSDYLQDEALTYYFESLCNIEDWSKLKESLIIRFQKVKLTPLVEMMKITQEEHETVTQYFHRKMQLINSVELNLTSIVELLNEGIKTKYKPYLATIDAVQPSEWLTMAIKVENSLTGSGTPVEKGRLQTLNPALHPSPRPAGYYGNSQVQRPPMPCRICERLGLELQWHYHSVCPYRSPTASRSPATPRVQRPTASRSFSSASPHSYQAAASSSFPPPTPHDYQPTVPSASSPDSPSFKMDVFTNTKIETLNDRNYAIWSMRLETLLEAKQPFEVIENQMPTKKENDPLSINIYEDWSRKNKEALGYMTLSMSPEIANIYKEIKNAREIWNSLKENFEGKTEDKAWIFGHDLEDGTLAIMASAKTRIYKHFLGLEMRGVQEDPPPCLEEDPIKVPPSVEEGTEGRSMERLCGQPPSVEDGIEGGSMERPCGQPPSVEESTEGGSMEKPCGQPPSDDLHTSRPLSIRNPENALKIKSAIKENSRINIRERSKDVDISFGTCQTIIKNDLHLKRSLAKFVPHLLTNEQKGHCKNMVEMFKYDPHLLKNVISGNETWVYGYDSETKRQSSQWLKPGEPRFRKARMIKSKLKSFLITFFDVKGLIHYEFMPEGQTINQDYYIDVLRRLKKAVCQKRPEK